MNNSEKISDSEEQQLLNQAKQILDQESQHLDYKTIMHLEKSRQQALKHSAVVATTSSINADGSIAITKYLPGSLIVVSLLLALTFYTLHNEPIIEEDPLNLYSDLELLGAKEPLDFYENIEFYEWLELNE